MSEEDALRKIQIAFDNETEVYIGSIEQCESTLDHTAQHYEGMLNLTNNLEDATDQHQVAKTTLTMALKQLSSIDRQVSHLEELAKEIAECASELDVKTLRLVAK